MAKETTAPEPHLRVAAAPRPASAVSFFRVRDFEKLQHYKNRNPPWVKLYRELILDYEFQQYPEVVRFHGIALLILASESNNKIPNDARWVAGRIGAHEPVDLDYLFRIGFLEAWKPRPQDSFDAGEQLELPEATAEGGGAPAGGSPPPGDASNLASNLLARPASAETDTETETEGETDTDTAPASAGGKCVCCGKAVFSRFSYTDALVLVKRWKVEGRQVGGRPIENIGGLARTLHQEGTADAEIEAMLRPPPATPKREFLDEPCPTCLGAKLETVPGKGARPCPDCVDEQGRRTGRKPKPVGIDDG